MNTTNDNRDVSNEPFTTTEWIVLAVMLFFGASGLVAWGYLVSWSYAGTSLC